MKINKSIAMQDLFRAYCISRKLVDATIVENVNIVVIDTLFIT